MKDKNESMQIFSVVEKGHKVVDVTKAIRKGVPASDATVTKNGYSFVPPPYNMEYLKELYDFNSTHKFCIFLKTNLCAGLGYRLKDKIPKSVAAFLKHPNLTTGETWTKFCKKLVLDEELYGRYAIEVVVSGKNVALYHIPANEILVVQDGDTAKVKSYLQRTKSGKMIPFRKYEFGENNDGHSLLVVDSYSPVSRFYGVPNYVSAIKAILGNDTISTYMLNFFANNARPDYFIIITGCTLTAEQRTSIETKLASVKGVENAHRLVTLTLGNPDARVEVKEMSKIIDDNFRNTKLDNRDEIAQIHGVPPKVLGVSSAGSLGSGSEAIGALMILVKCIITPKQVEFAEILNSLLQDLFSYNSEIFLFNTISLINEKDLAIIHKTYIEEGVISANEAREDLGLPSLGAEYDKVERSSNPSRNMSIENDSMYNQDPNKEESQNNQ